MPRQPNRYAVHLLLEGGHRHTVHFLRDESSHARLRRAGEGSRDRTSALWLRSDRGRFLSERTCDAGGGRSARAGIGPGRTGEKDFGFR